MPTTTASTTISLDQLPRGERAIVNTNGLAPDEGDMLSAMGLREGSEILVCRAGSPCIVQVEATRLGISKRMAQRILATPCQCADEERAANG